MAKVVLFALLLFGCTVVFQKVADWFLERKNIQIIPAALLELVPVIIFILHYGSEFPEDILWTCIAIAVVVAVTVWNLVKYGWKDGALASVAELGFSIVAAVLIVCIIVSRDQKRKYKRR